MLQRHRATEFLDLLKQIDAAMPDRPGVYLVMDKLRHPQDA